MKYERFKAIMTAIQEFDAKQERLDKFFEKELFEDSFCITTFGNSIQQTLINMLADEFNCWYPVNSDGKYIHWWVEGSQYKMSNDIEWWLYEASDDKTITYNDKVFKLDTLAAFYDYLMENFYAREISKHEIEYEDTSEEKLTMDESIEILKGLWT